MGPPLSSTVESDTGTATILIRIGLVPIPTQSLSGLSSSPSGLSTFLSGAETQQTTSMTGAGTQQTTSMTGAGTQQTTSMTGAGTQQTTSMTRAGTQQTTSMTAADTQQTTSMTRAETQQTTSMTAAGTQQTTSMSGAGTQQTTSMTGAGTQQTTSMTGAGTNATIEPSDNTGANGTTPIPVYTTVVPLKCMGRQITLNSTALKRKYDFEIYYHVNHNMSSGVVISWLEKNIGSVVFRKGADRLCHVDVTDLPMAYSVVIKEECPGKFYVMKYSFMAYNVKKVYVRYGEKMWKALTLNNTKPERAVEEWPTEQTDTLDFLIDGVINEENPVGVN